LTGRLVSGDTTKIPFVVSGPRTGGYSVNAMKLQAGSAHIDRYGIGMRLTSEAQIDDALTFSNTSPGPGTGTGKLEVF
jgi:hypothetical protein